MKNCVLRLILIMLVGLPGLSLPVSAQEALVLSAIEETPPLRTVNEVLRQAWQHLGIQIEILELPGLRGLMYSNFGKTDGEAFRVAGIEKEYPNLIRVDVAVRTDPMYLFVKRRNEFAVRGWGSIPKEYILGYKRGLKFAEYAIAEYGLRAEPVNRSEQMFFKLDRGRNDVIIAGVAEASRFIPQFRSGDIIRLNPPIHTSYLYHYLHKKHARLVPKITAVLKEMEASGKIRKICEQIEKQDKILRK